MAHRKILEITLKVVVDVDNDDLPEDRTSDAYQDELNEAIDNFVNGTAVSLGDTGDVSVHSAEVESYNITL